MIAQALRNFRASAGKHLSLVIVNADCQPREKAVHRQFTKKSFQFRVSSGGAAFGTCHLAVGI
jgi:hypothetical protein